MTGNKYQREEDMPALPGVLGLEIVRHYNSAFSGPGHPNGPLGRGWRLSYETELVDRWGTDGRKLHFNAAGKFGCIIFPIIVKKLLTNFSCRQRE